MLRKSFAYFVVGCAVLALSASASAGLVGSATLIKQPAATPFGNPDAALGAPWVSYRLSVDASAGDLIQAVTASITGAVHQRWTSSNSDSVYDTETGNSTNATNGDSHFMATNTMLFADGPHENNPFTGSPLSASNNADTGYGVGSSMSATFGPPGAGLSTINLAYLVVQKGMEPQVNLNFQIFNPTGDVIRTLTNADFGPFQQQQGNPPVVTSLSLINPVGALNATVSGKPTATENPTSWSPALNSLVLTSYTPGFGAAAGAPGLALTPSWDPTTQQFSWNTSGSTRGTYLWGVSATNAFGTGTGTISVEQHAVPEPASLTLLGLAVVGLVGLARRRG